MELVRSLYADWERGDYSSADWADSEIEWTIADGPDPGTWRGVAGMMEGFRITFAGVWKDLRAEVEEYRELDSERVLVLEWRRARGKMSGLDISNLRSGGAVLFHVRDGKVTRLVFYWDRVRAFADLGLSSDASPADS
jgi:ketosteroid isomerase-like protein